jgi:hypothetical protein
VDLTDFDVPRRLVNLLLLLPAAELVGTLR